MELRELCGAFVERSKEILKDNLCGIYLHGSAVMGCFNPEKSDADLIVIVYDTMPDAAKRAFLEMVVELNAAAPPKGIEMSVVRKDVCDPFQYPTPYELHFSAGHLDWYREDSEQYIQKMKGTDKDLAAHFTILRRRGECLYGLPIREVFGEVPKQDYLDSIWFDIENAREEITEYPMYLILNLTRVLAYCREELVLSKKEGAEWALGQLPPEYHDLIRAALREYTKGEDGVYDPECSKNYAEYMLREIGLTQAQNTLFHGTVIGGLNTILANARSHVDGSNVAYFTTDRIYALVCCRNRQENFVTMGLRDGTQHYFERFPDQLKILYDGKEGFLYRPVSSIGFHNTKGHTWESPADVPVVLLEHIQNVYAEILKEEAAGNVIIHRYAEIDPAEQKLHANYTRDHLDDPGWAEYREFLFRHFSSLWD